MLTCVFSGRWSDTVLLWPGCQCLAEAVRTTACRLSSVMMCAGSCSHSWSKTSVRTDRCSQTWRVHVQHEVRAVASNQGAGVKLLSGRCRFDALSTPSEGCGALCRCWWWKDRQKCRSPASWALKSANRRSNSAINPFSFVANQAPGTEAEVIWHTGKCARSSCFTRDSHRSSLRWKAVIMSDICVITTCSLRFTDVRSEVCDSSFFSFYPSWVQPSLMSSFSHGNKFLLRDFPYRIKKVQLYTSNKNG